MAALEPCKNVVPSQCILCQYHPSNKPVDKHEEELKQLKIVAKEFLENWENASIKIIDSAIKIRELTK